MAATEIEAAKSALVNNNALAGWCTIAVFIGLLAEYLILFWTKRKDFTRIEFVLAIAAAFLIAGGVFGEYFFGSRASEAALTLEGKSEENVATLHREAEQAKAREKEADARIAEAQRGVAEANAEALKLRLQLGQQDRRAHLRGADGELFKGMLKLFAGQKVAIVSVVGGEDGETLDLKTEFGPMMKAAGWNGAGGGSIYNMPTRGIHVFFSPPASPATRKAADALAAALNAVDLKSENGRPVSAHELNPGDPNAKLWPDTVVLLVAKHP